ncbi:MAG: mechanosensitive ion channel family protein [Deltaproteobacteria bacterium]|nr:mechanosensitive ion channel family protein [Deltaproteobacteria bacterium]
MDQLAQQWDHIWRLVQGAWRHGFLGTPVGDYLVALGIVLVGILLRGLLASLVLNRLRRLTARTKTTLDDELVEALAAPLRFVPVVVAVYLATEYLPLKGHAQTWAGQLNRTLFTFLVFWSLYHAVSPLFSVLDGTTPFLNRSVTGWLRKGAKWVLALLGGATILDTWGVAVGPIIAGFGLLGVAVSLGAQDMFKNLISGVTILAEKRFDLGDWVAVDGVVEGTVEQINFRSTVIRRFDKAPVFVPNNKLTESAMINYTQMPHRRLFWHLGLVYGTTVEQLRQIRDEIEGLLLGGPAFMQPPDYPLFVRVEGFSDSSIDLLVYAFTTTKEWGEFLVARETLALQVKRIVEDAGSSFAFPSRSLYVESLPLGRPEIFVPPPDEAPSAADPAAPPTSAPPASDPS